MTDQQDLFDQRSRELVCDGRELKTVLDDIASQGGFISMMTATCPGQWLLSVCWPECKESDAHSKQPRSAGIAQHHSLKDE